MKGKNWVMIIIGSVLGFIVGIWGAKILNYLLQGQDIPFLVVVIIAVLVFYISVAIHELGHFFAFIYNKISMRMLNITIFSFIFDGSRWKLAFNRNGAGVGGIAVPNLTIVSNEKEFNEMQKGHANAILWGPIVSFLLILVGGLLFTINGYLRVTGIMFICINLIMFFSCFIKMDGVYGDFPAYKAYKEDDFFAALMMYQYAMFAVDYENIRKNNTYLRNILFKGLIPRVENKKTDILTVACVATFIGEYLVGVADEVPGQVKEYIGYYYDNYKMIIAMKNTEANKQLLLYIAYFFEREGFKDEAIDIYKNFIQKLPKSEVFNYWKIQSEQIILGKDHSKHLLDKKNIKPGLAYGVFKKLDGFYHDELILNQMLT
ncbi:MAG TPA: hypothetical protein GX707_04300 [Epulopiscium sp.]|nr:hypothetical protein [Candidatus Epulonipiscium sp.]